jgi:ATP-dependent exoDNAse (exonuclease V) beta subunit
MRENGGALADSVRGQLPVVMIDEFQDTEPVQYGIFRHLYLDSPDCEPIMIGDPKQAICSFRGGDIYTSRSDARRSRQNWESGYDLPRRLPRHRPQCRRTERLKLKHETQRFSHNYRLVDRKQYRQREDCYFKDVALEPRQQEWRS